MPQQRTPRKNSKYYVPKETFLTAVHYCKQYPLWVAELSMIPDTIRGVSYDGDVVQTSTIGNITERTAIRRADIARKKELVDSVANQVAGEVLGRWLVQGVGFGFSFFALERLGIPCGKDLYYKLRQRFYFELSEKI